MYPDISPCRTRRMTLRSGSFSLPGIYLILAVILSGVVFSVQAQQVVTVQTDTLSLVELTKREELPPVFFDSICDEVIASGVIPATAEQPPEVPKSKIRVEEYRFKPAQLALPLSLITVGSVGVATGWTDRLNRSIRHELQKNDHKPLHFDDVIMFTPYAAYYGLSLLGVKARHDYVDRTILLGTAGVINAALVYSTKALTHVQRPDGSTKNSFPSGHTAIAFMGAELLRIEYAEASPWISVAGYAVATTTAFMRLYNNRHWLTDVVVGAGFGILSARAAYWLFPLLSEQVFHRTNKHIELSSFSTEAPLLGPSSGLSLAITF